VQYRQVLPTRRLQGRAQEDQRENLTDSENDSTPDLHFRSRPLHPVIPLTDLAGVL
jgi:hypothetical protein